MEKQSSIIKKVMPINWRACKDGTLNESGILNKTDPETGELVLLIVSDKENESVFTLCRGMNQWNIRDLIQHEDLGGGYEDGLLAVIDGDDATTAVTKFIEILESNNL